MTPQEILDRCLQEATSEFKPGSKEDMLLHSLVLRFKVAMERMSPFARRTPAATIGDGELPPLPDFKWANEEGALWPLSAMKAYARAAIEADRAQRQVAPASAQPADPKLSKLREFGLKVGHEVGRWVDPDADQPDVEAIVDQFLGAQPDQRESAAEGWRWVPVEPTDEMREACKHLAYADHIDEDWAAMLAAAPAAQPVAKDEHITNGGKNA